MTAASGLGCMVVCKDGRVKRSPVQGILAAVILATVSLLTNLQSPEDLSVVDVQPLLVTRLVLSYLTNGAVWALLLIFAGWSWGRRWWQAALWAIVCGELALAVHYLLGWAIGFFDWSDVCPTSTGSWRHWGMVSCWVSQVGSCVGPTAGVLPRPCSCQGGSSPSQ